MRFHRGVVGRFCGFESVNCTFFSQIYSPLPSMPLLRLRCYFLKVTQSIPVLTEGLCNLRSSHSRVDVASFARG